MTSSALCFDATGTLIEMTASVGSVYSEVARDFDIELPAWRLDDAFARVLRHAPLRGVVGSTPEERRQHEIEWWTERIRQTFQATDSTIRLGDFPGLATSLFDTYREARRWRVRPGVDATLAELSDHGHVMGVVSNFDHRLPELLQLLDLKKYFKTTAIPSENGARKPARAVFDCVAAALDAPVEALTYIGDDAPETLSEIGKLGLRIVDITAIPSFEALPEWLASPATLRSL